MKYVKILGLLAVAAAAMMAFAGTASATTVTSSAGTTPTIESGAEGHAVLDNPIAKIECASSVSGKVESHGSGVTAKGNIASLTFGSPVGTCTNDWHVTVVSAGSLEIHSLGNGNGTLTSVVRQSRLHGSASTAGTRPTTPTSVRLQLVNTPHCTSRRRFRSTAAASSAAPVLPAGQAATK